MDKQIIPIIAFTWVLSLLTTLAVVYIVPEVFPSQAYKSPIQIIEFVEPDEINVTGLDPMIPKKVASFVWTPKNPISSAIFAIHCSFEYRCDEPKPIVWEWEDGFWWELIPSISVNEFDSSYYYIRKGASSLDTWKQSGVTEWNRVSFLVSENVPNEDFWINPNEKEYSITFQTLHRDRASASTPTYVRNISILIEALDGVA